ncbi:hypothetical protein CEE36_10350 [candidate division TA06 bacterium B3_TA06]|uniref:DUF2085 domain-containing protein n=1 Tax=candidate division TA06 bacterium B3_TA06 TaxID=2012487 RepID=A0A532UW59_UNCT6|nr:MAG: hypothetical protein CEE36_10350 [candidate division TA06 bacterium B3_TA06]
MSHEVFKEDRIFIISWGVFIGIMTILLTGVIAAPLFELWKAEGIADFLYRAYHLSCHQLPSRSWFICGAKLGVCVRCLATYLFFIPIGVALFIRPLRTWIARRSFLRFVLPVWLGSLSLLLIDGLLQLVTPWESTNFLRFVTGGLAGVGTALLLGYLVLRFTQKVEASLR